MYPLAFRNTIVLTVIAICTAASITNEELAKILDDSQRSVVVPNLGEYDADLRLDSLRDKLRTFGSLEADNEDLYPDQDAPLVADGVSKRPFCNGFTGCGRIHGKRASTSLLEKLQISDSNQIPMETTVVKRPFCNGFFGCGNPGKRLVFRNFVKPKVYNVPRADPRKRFFCNPGAFGCSNRVKRSARQSIPSSKSDGILS